MSTVYSQRSYTALRTQTPSQTQIRSATDSRSPSQYHGIPSSPTTTQRLASIPSTAERLASRPSIWDLRSPQSTITPVSSAPVPAEPKENSIPSITQNAFKKDLLEVNTPSGGTSQALQNEYVFSPATRGFERKADSNSFAPRENIIEITGGTSDEFRYNNSESQVPEHKRKVNVGDTLWKTGGLIDFGPNYQADASVGDEDLGASADVTAGLQTKANASYGYDGNKLNVSAQGEVFYGVEVNAEAHAKHGPVRVGADIEGKVGAGANGSAGLVVDPLNGLSAEAKAEVFAGAELNLGADAGIGDSAELGAGLDLKAGIGAEAKGDVEIGLDEVGVDLEIGATLGIGADVSVDLSISPSGIVDDAGDVFDSAKGVVGSLLG